MRKITTSSASSWKVIMAILIITVAASFNQLMSTSVMIITAW